MKKNLVKLAVALTALFSVAAHAEQMNVAYVLDQPAFGSSGGDPVEVRTAILNSKVVFEAESPNSLVKDVLDLASMPRLALKAGQRLKRVEVRAAGEGAIAISINGQRVSAVQDISEKFEFQTYSIKVDRIIEIQDPLQVKVEIVRGQIRFMDVAAMMLKKVGGDSSNTVANAGKSSCTLEPAVTSHGWVLRVGGGAFVPYASPQKLFERIQGACQPMRFLCYVSETEFGKFALSVNLRGEVHQFSGSLGLQDAEAQLAKLQKSNFCAY
jgi:hypothetical protein